MTKILSLFLILPFLGCAYYSHGSLTLQASKVKDTTGIVSGNDPKALHQWERCVGFGCEEILKQRKEKK